MSAFDFEVTRIDGSKAQLSDYKGKVALMVNTASKCGFTPQFEGLEALHRKFEDRGFVVLGFPCNQFKEQDPESNEKIEEFCRITYHVSFPMFAKIEVNGPNESPLYRYLKEQRGFAGFQPNHPLTNVLKELLSAEDANYEKTSDIKWNFTKFLIARDGFVVERFEPTTDPNELENKIDDLL